MHSDVFVYCGRQALRGKSVLVIAVLAISCGADDDGEGEPIPACLAFDATSCDPLFVPSFPRIHQELLGPRCGVPGGSCHGEADALGADGGLTVPLALADAHDVLLAGEFVVAGDPACSPIMVRMQLSDPIARMPPGELAIDAGVLCSVGQWIANGAELAP